LIRKYQVLKKDLIIVLTENVVFLVFSYSAMGAQQLNRFDPLKQLHDSMSLNFNGDSFVVDQFETFVILAGQDSAAKSGAKLISIGLEKIDDGLKGFNFSIRDAL